LKFVIE